MNYIEFARLVWKMRKAQKAYFEQGQKRTDLAQAKRLEKQVDEALEQLIRETEQMKLWK